jgi:hypothetical protein
MEILNFDSNGSNRSPKKRARLVTIIGGAFLFAAVGSTFAANITINSGSIRLNTLKDSHKRQPAQIQSRSHLLTTTLTLPDLAEHSSLTLLL